MFETIFWYEFLLITNLQHGIPRGSGTKPSTDQDRRKEQQKINDYKVLVDSVNNKVCRSYSFVF